jgi:predicted Zn finger-like uncharacterized protein
MTVECPRCGTLYRQPPQPEPGADATYRCARCRHVFEAGDREPAMVSGDDEEHEFAFGDESEEGDAAPEPRFVAHLRDPEKGRPVKSPARFAVRTMLLVTLGFGVLSVYLYTNPEGVRTAFGNVPLIGARLTEAPLHSDAIQLTEVKGRYERVQGDRLVFVISGTAVNNAPVPARSIQIEGRIAGAQEQRQVVFCGAAPRDVQDLSLREIALLQTLEPPKDWALAPGEQADFLVVFAAPPSDLREFGAEVVAVQGPSRRG